MENNSESCNHTDCHDCSHCHDHDHDQLDDNPNNYSDSFSDSDTNGDQLIIDDDMCFPKATVDPKLLKLQKDVTEFITSVILKHEGEFYVLVEKHFKSTMQNILGTTCRTIIQMITETTNKLFNKIYFDIQNNHQTQLTATILEMTEYADYGPHILLDKLIRLVIDIHIDVNREKLVIDNNEIYSMSVLQEINQNLLSKNLLDILSKGEHDDIPFVSIPLGEKAFNINIDKNIDS